MCVALAYRLLVTVVSWLALLARSSHGLHVQFIQSAGWIGARQPVDGHAGGTGRGRQVRAAAVPPPGCGQPGVVAARDLVAGGRAAEAGRRGPPGADAVQGGSRRLERFALRGLPGTSSTAT